MKQNSTALCLSLILLLVSIIPAGLPLTVSAGRFALAGSLPAVPVDVRASDGAYPDKIRVAWGAPALDKKVYLPLMVSGSGGSLGTRADDLYYQVYRSTKDAPEGAQLLAGDHPASPYDDLAASAETPYYYWVKACNAEGCSDYSQSDSGWRAANIPEAPIWLSASDGDYSDRVSIMWIKPDHATYYQVYRNTESAVENAIQLADHYLTNTYEDRSVEPEVIYYYWVKACNPDGCSNYSAWDSGYRQGDLAIPSPPTSISASDGDYTDKVRIAWTAPANARYYQVFRNTSDEHYLQKTLAINHLTSTFDDLSAEPGIPYTYWVKACNSTDCSEYSPPDTGYRAETAPLPPANVSASDGEYSDRVNVSWHPSIGATYYQVFRNGSDTHDGQTILSESHPASPYEDFATVPLTTYYYWVKACNSAGCSGYSSVDTGWRSLINFPNGGFEAGNDGAWTAYSEKGRELIYQEHLTEVSAHSGEWLAWLGEVDDETATLSQMVTVPASQPYLHFWYQIDSADVRERDYARVKVNGSTLKSFDLCSLENTDGWTLGVVDLYSFTNSTITLQFEVKTDSSLYSNFFLDDVSLSASASASGLGSSEIGTLPGIPLD